MDKVIRSSY